MFSRVCFLVPCSYRGLYLSVRRRRRGSRRRRSLKPLQPLHDASCCCCSNLPATKQPTKQPIYQPTNIQVYLACAASCNKTPYVATDLSSCCFCYSACKHASSCSYCTNLPTLQTTSLPTYLPTSLPTNQPTYQPTNLPTNQSTNKQICLVHASMLCHALPLPIY